MKKIFIFISALFLFVSGQAIAQTMAPDGTFVGGTSVTMAPDGTFVGGTSVTMAPDGSFLGSFD
jgi:hypothetical protein